ncbi:MAG: ATP-binding protein [Candidatus Eisenbacteria bacterium]|nr:ATP-binding protein [Candidatus Eisenbacteria bacterium]
MKKFNLGKVGTIVALRWIEILILILLALYSHNGSFGTGITIPVLLAVFAISNIALKFVSNEEFEKLKLDYAVFILDILVISAVVRSCNAVKTDLYIVYFFAIMASALGREVKTSVVIGVVASCVYASGLLASDGLESVLSDPNLLLRIPLLLVVSLFTAFLAKGHEEERGRRARAELIVSFDRSIRGNMTEGQFADHISRWGNEETDLGKIGVALKDRRTGGIELSRGSAGLFAGIEKWLGRGDVSPFEEADGRIVAPIVFKTERLGFLVRMASSRLRDAEGKTKFLAALADQIGASLVNLRYASEARERARELRTLMGVARKISSTLELRDVRELVERSAEALVKAEDARLVLEGEEQDVSGTLASYLLKEVKESRKPVVANSMKRDGGNGTLTSLLVAPVKSRERLRAYLVVTRGSGSKPFGGRDIFLASGIAAQAAVALENAELYERTLEEGRRLGEACLDIQLEKNRLETLLENMVEVVILLDGSGRVVKTNTAATTLFGREPVRQGALAREAFSGSGELLRFVEATLSKPMVRKERVELNGSFFNVNAVPLVRSGTYSGMLLVFDDISELTKANELKSEFVSQVSHELKTPLSSIIGATTLLAGGRAGEVTAKQKELLGIVRKESEDLLTLINEVLDLRKLESGLEMNFEFNSIGTIAEDCVRGLTPLAEAKGLELSLDCGSGLPDVYCDGMRISQVFRNILGNAIKYTPGGGKVTCDLFVEHGEHEGAEVRVRVSDTGPGIPPAKRGMVFEKFVRLRSHDQPETAGTGLGLTIAKDIVTRHGGKIWFEPNPSGGSIFCFSIPLEMSSSEIAAAVE